MGSFDQGISVSVQHLGSHDPVQADLGRVIVHVLQTDTPLCYHVLLVS